jgi:hypothetical protein
MSEEDLFGWTKPGRELKENIEKLEKQKYACPHCGNDYVNVKNHLKSCKENPDNKTRESLKQGVQEEGSIPSHGTLWVADLDEIIEAIRNYDGHNPDFKALRDNFKKTGGNGVYYRRIVMNVLNFIGQVDWEASK